MPSNFGPADSAGPPPVLVLLPQALAFNRAVDNSFVIDSSRRLFAHEIFIDRATSAQPERMEQMLAEATARTLAHKLSWWFVDLSDGFVHIVQYAAQSACLRASGVRIAVYTGRSHARNTLFLTALPPMLTVEMRFDVLLSAVNSAGLPYTKPYMTLRADGRLGFSPISHISSLPSARALADLTATRRASARSRGPCRLLSLGDAGREHTLSIRAAHALGMHVRVIGGTDETLDVDAARSECAALGSACRWDRERTSRAAFLREIEKADVCAVSIPLFSQSPNKIGIGITTAGQAAARGVPVITLDYAHFRGYLKDGCNAVLINASTLLPGNALPSERIAHASAADTRAIRHAMDRREKLFHCSANFAAQFTVERVAKEVNRTLAHVPPRTASTSFCYFCIFRPTLLRLSSRLEDLVKDLHELAQAAAVAVTHMKVVAVAAVGLHVAVFCVFATLVVAAVVSWQLRRARRKQRFCGVPVRLRQDDAQQAHTVPNGSARDSYP